MTVEYTIEFPDYFADEARAIETKGYFGDAVVRFAGGAMRPAFYDQVRFAQECEDALQSGQAYFAEPLLVIVRSVVRKEMVTAVDVLAARDFVDLLPDLDD